MFYWEYYSYFFLLLVLAASLMVILSKNPILSVFFLILAFILSAVLLLLLGVEFMAVVLLMVYVGAISVLFLFVVMLLNLRLVELHSMFFSYFSVGWFLLFFTIVVFFMILGLDYGLFKSVFFLEDNFFDSLLVGAARYNITYLGNVLYNVYGHLVLIAGLVLLLAMMASIVLTVDFSYREKMVLPAYHKPWVASHSVFYFKF